MMNKRTILIFTLVVLSILISIWGCETTGEEDPLPNTNNSITDSTDTDDSTQTTEAKHPNIKTIDVYSFSNYSHTDTYTYDSQDRITNILSRNTQGDAIYETRVVYNSQGHITDYIVFRDFDVYRILVDETNTDGQPTEATFAVWQNNSGSTGDVIRSGTYTYSYNTNGQLTQRVIKTSNNTNTTKFTYNSNNQLTQCEFEDGSILNLSYDTESNLSQSDFPNEAGRWEYNKSKVTPNWYIFDNNSHYYLDYVNDFSFYSPLRETLKTDKAFSKNLITAYSKADGAEESIVSYELDSQDRPSKITVNNFDFDQNREIWSYEISYVE